ncbi:aminotransferase class I/II-fold pyridoxal phosphate-dependent enzyme [Microbacterium rhizomatis]|uniref:8-amino-7-oxononanoate synthase n=2 Tax=Microbacterium rhizomatis TaxID=1631477 RepID=A0A5J5J1C7_9MICO|nr:aminotransferase class I/II-fold pyridoxal phosphate-dependent enzyme [Microbacterium rhizomatis]
MARAAGMSMPFLDEAVRVGVHGLIIDDTGPSASMVIDDKELTNMSSYSYLGLDEHPRIMQAAHEGLTDSHVLNSSLSRVRVRLRALNDVEERLSCLFDADVGTVSSCAAGVWSMLPLLASGVLSNGIRPVMVFDRHAHFCLQSLRPLCAMETDVRTIAHNDMEKLEQICRENPCVAYVGDGIYSTGGTIAPMDELMRLQDQYGMYLFLDDAHGTSIVGEKGRGYVLDAMGDINEHTIIVTSLNKGFGATGGAIIFGPRSNRTRRRIALGNGGPFTWSQRVNTPGLGAILGSCDIHEGSELGTLQAQLKIAIQTFDDNFRLPHANPKSPVRFVPIGSETETIRSTRSLMDAGYYVEPDFFPAVMWGKAGLRIRLRANMTGTEITQFCAVLSEHFERSGVQMAPALG